MAFTASLAQRINESGKVRFIIALTDGVTTLSQEITQPLGGVDIESVKRQVANTLADLNNPKPLPIGVIDTAPATVTPPTQAQLDQVQWLNDWANLKGANELIAAGVIVDTLPAYVALKNKVIANFKNVYVTLL